MNLTTSELAWATQHLTIYKIPYQEVFDEGLDHIISAMEQARAEGNAVPIERLFQDVVDEQFNGYIGIDEIVKTQEKAYQKKVRRLFWKNFRSVLDWKAIIFIIVLCGIAYLLPAKIIITKIILVTTFSIEFVPLVYIYITTRRIKAGKGRKSLIRRVLMANGFLPFMLLNCYLNITNCVDDINDSHKAHAFMLGHPEIAALIMALTIIYSISSIYMCRQEVDPYKLSL